MFKVGQKVYCLMYGHCEIIQVNCNAGCPLKVGFKFQHEYYTSDGKYYIDSNQTLFPVEALSFDEQGRVIAINYDYEPPVEVEHEFKTFDRVLVKEDAHTGSWIPALFAYQRLETTYIENPIGAEEIKEIGYYVIGNETDYFTLCIPYEGNEHLVGTSESPA